MRSQKESKSRGAVLIAALLISMVLLLVGLGFLGQRRGQYQAAREAINRCRAEALSDAGLQDALGKLAKDYAFPPLHSADQSDFVYSETLKNSAGESVGTYSVTITIRYRRPPYNVVRVTSRGYLGSAQQPIASCVKTAEIDFDPTRIPFRVLFVTTNEG